MSITYIMNLVQKLIFYTSALSLCSPMVYSQLKEGESTLLSASAATLSPQNFTYGYWLNSRRKHKGNLSPDILAFETGYYGFHLNLDNLKKCKFGHFSKALNYREAHLTPRDTSPDLHDAKLNISIKLGDKTYEASSAVAGASGDLGLARIWESGRNFQHFDILGLNFISKDGEELPCKADLNIKAWPESLKIDATLEPSLAYPQGSHLGIIGKGFCTRDHGYSIDLKNTTNRPTQEFTIEQWIKIPNLLDRDNKGVLFNWGGSLPNKNKCSFKVEHHIFSAHTRIGGKNIDFTDNRRKFKIGSWNHIALTYNGRLLTLYINGRYSGSRSASGNWSLPSRTIHLGHHNGHGNIEAVFDQTRFYKKALTSSQVSAHFNNPKIISEPLQLQFNKDFEKLPAAEIDRTAWENASISLSLSAPGTDLNDNKGIKGTWSLGEKKQLSITSSLASLQLPKENISISVKANALSDIKTFYDPEWLAYSSTINSMRRRWRTGYTDIRNYDEFDISIEHKGSSPTTIPYALHLNSVANITGLCPILCHEDGTPTGIPVQLSKNWHIGGQPSYFKGFALLPVVPGKTNYKLRLVYGFYGTLPSASHAQLSLIGYGGKGRWDQLAIGSWGETICFDSDMSLVDVAITDVRLLMTRDGEEGRKWTWTDAGWGGDWLGAVDKKGKKLAFNNIRTAYYAHGPCLTDVSFTGYYGENREISFKTDVSTTRSDDYARTFHKFKYVFNEEVAAKDTWFFKLGRSPRAIVNKIAFGNDTGLKGQIIVPASAKPKEKIFDQVQLPGEAPWWLGLPDNTLVDKGRKADGNRSFVVRSYKARFGGKTYHKPNFSTPIFRKISSTQSSVDLLLTPPKEILTYKKGDIVEFELEFLTMPRKAVDYYGPNTSFRSFLAQNPQSWKSIMREAKENNLIIKSEGGIVKSSYPIEIESITDTVHVKIEGGTGYAPIKFTHLKSHEGYQLYKKEGSQLKMFDQSVHGNDYWQTNYNHSSNSFERVYNIPLDSDQPSKWVLKRK